MKLGDALNDMEMAQTMAGLGDVDAIVSLATIFFYGLGVKKDTKKGLEYFYSAAEKGSAEANFKLGLFYNDGRAGLVKCEKTALEYFEKSMKTKGRWFGNPMYKVEQIMSCQTLKH